MIILVIEYFLILKNILMEFSTEFWGQFWGVFFRFHGPVLSTLANRHDSPPAQEKPGPAASGAAVQAAGGGQRCRPALTPRRSTPRRTRRTQMQSSRREVAGRKDDEDAGTGATAEHDPQGAQGGGHPGSLRLPPTRTRAKVRAAATVRPLVRRGADTGPTRSRRTTRASRRCTGPPATTARRTPRRCWPGSRATPTAPSWGR